MESVTLGMVGWGVYLLGKENLKLVADLGHVVGYLGIEMISESSIDAGKKANGSPYYDYVGGWVSGSEGSAMIDACLFFAIFTTPS